MKLSKYQTVYIILAVALLVGLAASIVVEIMSAIVVFRDGRDQFTWIFIVMSVVIVLLLVVLAVLVYTFIKMSKEKPQEDEVEEKAEQVEAKDDEPVANEEKREE